MARKPRDYAKEYERRIAKGLAAGKTRQAARGQAKAEPTRRSRERAQKVAGQRTQTSAEKSRAKQKAAVRAKRALTPYQTKVAKKFAREQEAREGPTRGPPLFPILRDWILSRQNGWNDFKTLVRSWRDEAHSDYRDEVLSGQWDWKGGAGGSGPWTQIMNDHLAAHSIPDQRLLWYH